MLIPTRQRGNGKADASEKEAVAEDASSKKWGASCAPRCSSHPPPLVSGGQLLLHLGWLSCSSSARSRINRCRRRPLSKSARRKAAASATTLLALLVSRTTLFFDAGRGNVVQGETPTEELSTMVAESAIKDPEAFLDDAERETALILDSLAFKVRPHMPADDVDDDVVDDDGEEVGMLDTEEQGSSFIQQQQTQVSAERTAPAVSQEVMVENYHNDLMHLARHFRARCLQCQARVKILAEIKRVPDAKYWIDRMDRAGRLCIDLYTNILVYRASAAAGVDILSVGAPPATVPLLELAGAKIRMQQTSSSSLAELASSSGEDGRGMVEEGVAVDMFASPAATVAAATFQEGFREAIVKILTDSSLGKSKYAPFTTKMIKINHAYAQTASSYSSSFIEGGGSKTKQDTASDATTTIWYANFEYDVLYTVPQSIQQSGKPIMSAEDLDQTSLTEVSALLKANSTAFTGGDSGSSKSAFSRSFTSALATAGFDTTKLTVQAVEVFEAQNSTTTTSTTTSTATATTTTVTTTTVTTSTVTTSTVTSTTTTTTSSTATSSTTSTTTSTTTTVAPTT
ncbi:unnamed protein product, partial [Amoebophrya sp. A25]|eukprot:GSA25T00009582001.1